MGRISLLCWSLALAIGGCSSGVPQPIKRSAAVFTVVAPVAGSDQSASLVRLVYEG